MAKTRSRKTGNSRHDRERQSLIRIGFDDCDYPLDSRIQPSLLRPADRVFVIRADGIWTIHRDRFVLCSTTCSELQCSPQFSLTFRTTESWLALLGKILALFARPLLTEPTVQGRRCAEHLSELELRSTIERCPTFLLRDYADGAPHYTHRDAMKSLGKSQRVICVIGEVFAEVSTSYLLVIKGSMQSSRLLYQFDSFCLDVEERVLLREGHVVPLPAKALSTLLVLLRNKGHLVEKDVLMSEVWPDEFVEEGNLAQHIFMLRRALGETTGSAGYIETVPRRGYRFVGKLKDPEDGQKDRVIGSVAILPFANVSGDPSMEYLSDGITENIMTRLSRLPQLKVMARSSVFRYKGVAVDPQEVGNKLGVRAVMMGRVQQLGEHLTISAELVDAQDGSLIWGDRYHRKYADIFLIQEELSSEISERLRLRLSKEQRESLVKRFTDDTEAYEFYLKGRYAWSKRSGPDLRRAVDYFRQAIIKDPNYALAYTGLADSLGLLGLLGAEPPRKVMGEAKTAASKAIRLSEDLGEAYASLAQIKVFYDWDWQGAEADFQTALRLSPAYATAHQWYGEYLVAMGRTEEGLTELRRARDLDPLSLIINTDLGLNFYWARQYDLAIEQLESALELEPNFFRAHLYLGAAYSCKQMYREAIMEMEKAKSLSENPYTLAGLGYVYASVGEQAKAEGLLERLLQLSRERFVSSATIALLHGGFPDHLNQTLQYLERAYEQRTGFLVWLNVCPVFDAIRTEQRFVALLSRIGLANFAGD